MADNRAKEAMNKASTQVALNQVANDMPMIIEQAKVMAKLVRVNYDAYIGAGFTKEEALVLCRK